MFIAALFYGCSKDGSSSTPPPTVDFTYLGANAPAPATVSFISSSTYATSYLWDFGDNGSSTQTSPTHQYTNSGVYTVKLTVTGAGGTNYTTKTINILPPPTTLKINKITVTGMPFIDGSGAGWDPSNGPDVYLNITDTNNNILSGPTSIINNVTSANLPLIWTYTTPYVITNFTSPQFINLWDYDTLDPDDYIGYVGFLISNYTTGTNPYPSSITKTQNSITVVLTVTWQ